MKRVQIMQFFFFFFLKIGRTSTFLRVFTIISKDSSSDEKLIGVQWSTVSVQKHSKMHDWTSETYKRWGCTFFSCLKACVRGDFYCEPAGKEWHYLRIKISFCIYDASTPPPAAPPKFLSRLKSCSNWASFTFLLVINCIQIYIHQRFQTLFSVV